MGDEVLMSGGDGVGRMEFNKETWNAAGAGAENEFVIKRNESTGTVASGNDSIVRWEKFLPKMILRVLLVEADDSTRQIIAALLRKCNYRVSAVSDGLKAWEVMKSRPQNIDLILTEVDLPSISGFALLTLIMEHSICKNIPVIMMSSQDSVNTVYKCMLRGAADFLVKPVRKNELKNLWQHVWRRQASSSSGIGPPDESVAQQTLEATAENIDTSNCLSADIVGFKRSREGVEKGSDDQSSCTKPESEVEGTELNCKQDLWYSKLSKTSSTKGSPIIVDIDCKENSQQDTPKTDDDSRCFDFNKQACGDSHALNSSKEAIDLIGAFDKHLDCINNRNGNSYVPAYISMSTDSLPFLDLSLKSPLPYVTTNNVMEERCSLKHSDASAFSRYVNKTPYFRHSLSPTPCNQLDNLEAISDKQIFPDQSEPVIIISPKSMPLASDQPEKIENRLLLPPLVPFTGSKFQSIGPPPPAFYTLTGTSQMQSPDPVNHQETSFQASFNPLNNPSGDYLPSCNNPPSEKSVTDRSANSGMCNGTHGNLGPESNGKVESVSRRECGVEGKVESVSRREFGAEGKVESLSRRECGVEDSFRVNVGDSFRSAQREAALTKFRLKRKDRCFEKKVRYESRKKLAEKRPRVKGQFVCQLSNHGKSSLV